MGMGELLYNNRWKLALLQQMIWFSIFNQLSTQCTMSGDSNYIYKYYIYIYNIFIKDAGFE